MKSILNKCITGKNQSGRKLRPGVIPEEIYPIDVWREEKRITGFEPIIPSARPPGFARKEKRRNSKICTGKFFLLEYL